MIGHIPRLKIKRKLRINGVYMKGMGGIQEISAEFKPSSAARSGNTLILGPSSYALYSLLEAPLLFRSAMLEGPDPQYHVHYFFNNCKPTAKESEIYIHYDHSGVNYESKITILTPSLNPEDTTSTFTTIVLPKKGKEEPVPLTEVQVQNIHNHFLEHVHVLREHTPFLAAGATLCDLKAEGLLEELSRMMETANVHVERVYSGHRGYEVELTSYARESGSFSTPVCLAPLYIRELICQIGAILLAYKRGGVLIIGNFLNNNHPEIASTLLEHLRWMERDSGSSEIKNKVQLIAASQQQSILQRIDDVPRDIQIGYLNVRTTSTELVLLEDYKDWNKTKDALTHEALTSSYRMDPFPYF